MSQPTHTIRHPNKPNVAVHLRKPLRADYFAHGQKERQSVVPIAVRDAAGNLVYHERTVLGADGKPVLGKDGSPVVTKELALYVQPGPIDPTDRIALYAHAWENVTDADGNILPFHRDNLRWLGEEHLDCKLDVCYDCKEPAHAEGKEYDHRFNSTPSFGLYIMNELGNPKLFDPDPPATVSASPSM